MRSQRTRNRRGVDLGPSEPLPSRANAPPCHKPGHHIPVGDRAFPRHGGDGASSLPGAAWPASVRPQRRAGASRAAPPLTSRTRTGGADPSEAGRQRKVRSADRVPRSPRLRPGDGPTRRVCRSRAARHAGLSDSVALPSATSPVWRREPLRAAHGARPNVGWRWIGGSGYKCPVRTGSRGRRRTSGTRSRQRPSSGTRAAGGRREPPSQSPGDCDEWTNRSHHLGAARRHLRGRGRCPRQPPTRRRAAPVGPRAAHEGHSRPPPPELANSTGLLMGRHSSRIPPNPLANPPGACPWSVIAPIGEGVRDRRLLVPGEEYPPPRTSWWCPPWRRLAPGARRLPPAPAAAHRAMQGSRRSFPGARVGTRYGDTPSPRNAPGAIARTGHRSPACALAVLDLPALLAKSPLAATRAPSAPGDAPGIDEFRAVRGLLP